MPRSWINRRWLEGLINILGEISTALSGICKVDNAKIIDVDGVCQLVSVVGDDLAVLIKSLHGDETVSTAFTLNNNISTVVTSHGRILSGNNITGNALDSPMSMLEESTIIGVTIEIVKEELAAIYNKRQAIKEKLEQQIADAKKQEAIIETAKAQVRAEMGTTTVTPVTLVKYGECGS